MFRLYSKYRSRKCEIDGIVFASQAEGALYCLLKKRFSEIYCQPKVYLTKANILYKPDFFAGGIYFEMKGMELPIWRIKKRLWKAYGPADLHIFKILGKIPALVEIVPSAAYDEQPDKLLKI